MHVDRLLYWFLTRTPTEKLVVIALALIAIAFVGLVILSVLSMVLSALAALGRPEQIILSLQVEFPPLLLGGNLL